MSIKNAEKRLLEGKSLFFKKEYRASILVLSSLLNHPRLKDEAQLYVALNHYYLKEYSRAYPLFSLLRKQQLLPRSHYFLYAFSAYKMRYYRESYEGMIQVPQGGELYDIARYYAGVSLFHLKEHKQALALLKQAVILPQALAISRRTLIKNLERILKKQPASTASRSKAPKKSAPQVTDKPSIPALSSSTILPAPRIPESAAKADVLYWGVDPTFQPAQKSKLFSLYSMDVGFHHGWELASQASPSQGHKHYFGWDVAVHGRYGVEHIRESVTLHGTDVKGPFLDAVVAEEGERHDHILLIGRTMPWVQWNYKNTQFGLEAGAEIFYGEFREDNAYIPKFQGGGSFHYAFSENFMASVKLQADYWLRLSYGPAARYAGSLEFFSRINPVLDFSIGASGAIYQSEKKSYNPLASYALRALLHYHTPFKLTVKFGGDLEYLRSYQIWPRDTNVPMRAHGFGLGVTGGVEAYPRDYLTLSFFYTSSRISWESAGASALSEAWWQWAPKGAGFILGRVVAHLPI